MEKAHVLSRRELAATATERLSALPACERGAMVIETALILPIVIMMIFGIISYGSWFMVAHGVQQAANDGARAAVAGLNDTDRRTIATDAVNSAIVSAPSVDRQYITTEVARSGPYYTVTVVYSPANPAWVTNGLLPISTGPIRRQSTVKLNTM